MKDHPYVQILKRDYPYHITIDPYKMLPRPESLRGKGCSSWVEARGQRTFGFKDEAKAKEFMAKYGGTYFHQET